MFPIKSVAKLLILLLLCVTLSESRGTHDEMEKMIAKRGVVEDMITAGDGQACSYIIQFAYTMAKRRLAKLTEYMLQNIPYGDDVDRANGDGGDFVLNERAKPSKFEMDLKAMLIKENVEMSEDNDDFQFKSFKNIVKRDTGDDDTAPGDDQDTMVQQDGGIFTSLVTSSRGLSCKLIVEYMKYYATSSFKALIKYVTSNLTNIVG